MYPQNRFMKSVKVMGVEKGLVYPDVAKVEKKVNNRSA